MANEKVVGDLLKLWMNENKLLPKVYQSQIAEVWEQLMGRLIAGQTRSIRIDNRILYLEVQSAALRNELFMQKESMIEKLNEALGETYIQSAVIR
jgi:predicted nucleic acid-binding Zn ribbon protein